jgi:hypothetical protein
MIRVHDPMLGQHPWLKFLVVYLLVLFSSILINGGDTSTTGVVTAVGATAATTSKEEESSTISTAHTQDEDDTNDEIASSSSRKSSTIVSPEECPNPEPNEPMTHSDTSNDGTTTTTAKSTASSTSSSRMLPKQCQIVLSRSKLQGLGVFVMAESGGVRGKSILGNHHRDGDVIIQLTDPVPIVAPHPISHGVLLETDPGMKRLIHNYVWSSEETGGFYEGIQVSSVMPGLGMLCNGGLHRKQPQPPPIHPPLLDDTTATTTTWLDRIPSSNAFPGLYPQYDEGGLTRAESPGAGAISFYHNHSFYYQTNVPAGQEILVPYGELWFAERIAKQRIQIPEVPLSSSSSKIQEPSLDPPTHDNLEWLRTHSMCLDNLRPGPSRIDHAGRGVFAARFIDQGDVVAPVPVLPLLRQSLQITRHKQKKDEVWHSQQLLLNYCYGHPDSSLLFFPYGVHVNLINHAGGKLANVKLQWSNASFWYDDDDNDNVDWMRRASIQEILENPWRLPLVLELVATRPIRTGDEIVLDYGRHWVDAWIRHIQQWKPVPDADTYVPSYVMNDVIKSLRTEAELREYPYPENVFTSCFYRYSDQNNLQQQTTTEAKRKDGNDDDDAVTTVRWQLSRGLLELRNLRPCTILQRNDATNEYTVRIRNRYGLAESERIPNKTGKKNKNIPKMHIVTHIPRFAIRFSDKIYTTDQHLENAFRHEINFPDHDMDHIYPEQWKDLSSSEDSETLATATDVVDTLPNEATDE